MMKAIHATAATFLVTLILSASAHAQRLPPDLVVSNPQVYEVTITTNFVVPENGKILSGIGVWHALPNARPWDGLDRTLGASAISFEPANGRIQHLATNESQNVFWEVRERIEPRQEARIRESFQSALGRSHLRRQAFDREVVRLSSQSRCDHAGGRCQSRQRSSTEIKQTHPPAEAALEFCKWVTEHIKYDASVAYDARDLRSILNFRERPLRASDDDVRGDVHPSRNSDENRSSD